MLDYLDEALSDKIAVMLHLHGSYTPKCLLCPWRNVLKNTSGIPYEAVVGCYENLQSMSCKVRETHILCPNPTKHSLFNKIYRVASENSKSVAIWLHPDDLECINRSVVEESDRILIITQNYDKLYEKRSTILTLESMGFENIEVLFTILPGVNTFDTPKVIEFCRVRGLKLIITPPLFTDTFYGVERFLDTTVRNYRVSGDEIPFLGCYYKTKALKEDYMFSIIKQKPQTCRCNLLYIDNSGSLKKCPLASRNLELDGGSRIYECSVKSGDGCSEYYKPVLRIALIDKRGRLIETELLEMLDLIDKYGSIRRAAEVKGLSHTALRKKISFYERELSIKLLEKNFFSGKTILTTDALRMLDAYRKALDEIKRRYSKTI